MAKLALSMRLSNQAVTQYDGYDYDGACVDQTGQPFGGSESGLFKLEEPVPDAEVVDAYFKTPVTDFGQENQKRMRALYLGGETDGQVSLSMATDEDGFSDFTVMFDKEDLSQAGAKAYGTRLQKGRYWQFKVANVTGSDFSIDHLSVVPIILAAKPGRRS